MEATGASTHAPSFQIQFRSLSGAHGTLDAVHASDLAGSVLERIAAKTGVPQAERTTLRLMRAGKSLDVSSPCGLVEGETVHLLSRGCGGVQAPPRRVFGTLISVVVVTQLTLSTSQFHGITENRRS